MTAPHATVPVQLASAGPATRRRFTLTAELLEDAQLGSGLSGSGLNALVTRDRDDRPVLWASHLEGLLRDVARFRREARLANQLFGKAGGDRQLALFTSLYCTSQDAPSRVWRSTARESFDNRAPKDDSLRAVEMVPRGTTFRGHVELPDDPALIGALERWLCELDAVGHGRAAGAGRVRFTVEESTVEPRTAAPMTDTGQLRLLLRNLDPLCLAATTTPSNLIPTLPYVPGRSLLGAIASWLLQGGQHELAALVTSEQLSFGDALPLPRELETAALEGNEPLDVLPAPLALRRAKPADSSGALPWWACHEPATERSFLDPNGPKEPPMGPRKKGLGGDCFAVRRGEGAWDVIRPVLQTRLRNGRPDPERKEPLLFAVEQLAERSLFQADLFGPPALLARLVEGLRPLLEGRSWLRLGRAGAPVEVMARACPTRTPPSLDKGLLILTSDLLVRDDQLRWYSAVPEEPERRARFFEHAGLPRDLHLQVRAQDGTTVRGFNGTARLWRLPLGGIRRGSVFDVSGPGLAELLRAAHEARWLGERTHEGCGRFRIEPTREPPGVTKPSGKPAAEPQRKSGVQDDPEEPICQTTRAWCAAYRDKLEREASEAPPSLSQWMDLAAAIPTDRDAIERRLAPTTRGGRAWTNAAAHDVLVHLKALPENARAAHAHLFIRWLRSPWPKKDAQA